MVTPQREPLGVIDAWIWAREFKDAEGQRPGLIKSTRRTEGYERVAEMAATLPGRAGHTERQVRQRLFAARVTVSDGQGGRFAATCVMAQELGAPQGVKPLEWRLLTNRAAATLEAAVELIDWYRARWEIEIYFHVNKNGCRVEALQLGHIDKLELALTVYMVVAWRLARLLRLGRTHPTGVPTPCSARKNGRAPTFWRGKSRPQNRQPCARPFGKLQCSVAFSGASAIANPA